MKYLNVQQRGDRTVLPRSQIPASMVSFDEGYQGDQAISLEGLELDLSSDFESVHDEIISTPPSMAEDRKMDFDGECSVTVLAVSEEEEEHEDSEYVRLSSFCPSPH
jgi:hypothetical protein